MREILFRGKLTNNRGWSYGNLSIKPNNECAIITPDDTVVGKYGKVDIETVGQYTGLKDKNGTKIFEGDIVKVLCKPVNTNHATINDYGVVEYDAEFAEYIISFYHIRFDDEDSLGNFRFGRCEVIGNKHDNPELLEVGEQ